MHGMPVFSSIFVADMDNFFPSEYYVYDAASQPFCEPYYLGDNADLQYDMPIYHSSYPQPDQYYQPGQHYQPDQYFEGDQWLTEAVLEALQEWIEDSPDINTQVGKVDYLSHEAPYHMQLLLQYWPDSSVLLNLVEQFTEAEEQSQPVFEGSYNNYLESPTESTECTGNAVQTVADDAAGGLACPSSQVFPPILTHPKRIHKGIASSKSSEDVDVGRHNPRPVITVEDVDPKSFASDTPSTSARADCERYEADLLSDRYVVKLQHDRVVALRAYEERDLDQGFEDRQKLLTTHRLQWKPQPSSLRNESM